MYTSKFIAGEGSVIVECPRVRLSRGGRGMASGPWIRKGRVGSIMEAKHPLGRRGRTLNYISTGGRARARACTRRLTTASTVAGERYPAFSFFLPPFFLPSATPLVAFSANSEVGNPPTACGAATGGRVSDAFPIKARFTPRVCTPRRAIGKANRKGEERWKKSIL